MKIPFEIIAKILEYIPKKYEDEFMLKQVSKTFTKILYLDNILNTNWFVEDEDKRLKMCSEVIKK